MKKRWKYAELTAGADEIIGDARLLPITRQVVLLPQVRRQEPAPAPVPYVRIKTAYDLRQERLAKCTKERMYVGQLFWGWGELNMLVASGGVMYARLRGQDKDGVLVGQVVDVDCGAARSYRYTALSYVYREAVEAVFGPGIDLAGYGYVEAWAAGSRRGEWYPQGDSITSDLDPPKRPRKPRVRNRPFNPTKGEQHHGKRT